jgi:hypothetical protein
LGIRIHDQFIIKGLKLKTDAKEMLELNNKAIKKQVKRLRDHGQLTATLICRKKAQKAQDFLTANHAKYAKIFILTTDITDRGLRGATEPSTEGNQGNEESRAIFPPSFRSLYLLPTGRDRSPVAARGFAHGGWEWHHTLLVLTSCTPGRRAVRGFRPKAKQRG